jgi:iron complex transport system substrate-binding protein
MRIALSVLLGFTLTAMAQSDTPRRIVSLIPALTETRFAIGAGASVVAVSSFDDYPPAVRKLERVGALLDPDLERILALKPDLVTVYASQEGLRRQLERAGVAAFVYKHAGLADVSTTILELGARVRKLREAEALVKTIDTRLASVRERVSGRPRPRTLIVFAREPLALRGIYGSGGVGFLNDMLTVAGGENIFADVKRESVQATAELILARRPEAIIELRIGEISPDQQTQEIAVWHRLTSLPAVRSGRVSFVTDARAVVPGPRVAEGTELLARLLHPGAFKQEEPKSGRELHRDAARYQPFFERLRHQPLEAAPAPLAIR